MFLFGSIVGFILGSFVTCGIFYFGFRAEENKEAELHNRNLEESVKKEMEQLTRRKASNDD